MDFQLPEDEDRDYDTLGGLVFAQLAVIPEDGSRPVVEALGLRIRVEELCDPPGWEWALVEKQAPLLPPANRDALQDCRGLACGRSCFFRPRAGRSERKELHP